jgi:sortase A
VASGALILALVSFRIARTDALTSRAQADLRLEVSAHGFADYVVPRRDARLRAPARTTTRLIPGGALGFIRIPRIHLDMVFVQGVTSKALQMGPGHYPGTPLPGQAGNVAIAGHRTTYLHPFWSLDQLRPGDLILIQTREGSYAYVVQWQKILLPTAMWVVAPTQQPSLTLTTCTPRFSASERLVIRAVMVPATAKGS